MCKNCKTVIENLLKNNFRMLWSLWNHCFEKDPIKENKYNVDFMYDWRHHVVWPFLLQMQ